MTAESALPLGVLQRVNLQRQVLEALPADTPGSLFAPADLEDLLSGVERNGHPMDWTLHLELGYMLGAEVISDIAVRRGLLWATARRWLATVSSPRGHGWVAVRCGDPEAIYALRPATLGAVPRLVRVQAAPLAGQPAWRIWTASGLGSRLAAVSTWEEYRPWPHP